MNRCTFCDEIKSNIPEGENMCRDCDAETMAHEKVFRATFTSRACRGCGGPTGAGRYFHCVKCVEDLEPSSDWESFDDVDQVCRDIVEGMGKAKAAKFTGPKVCRTCKQEKDRSLFGRMTRAFDGLDSQCKACEKQANLARRKERQSAVLEQRGMEASVETLQLEGIQLPLQQSNLPETTNQ